MLSLSTSGAKSGPIIVFLHAAGINSWMWRDITSKLPGSTHVLVDLPGHGKSNTTRWDTIAASAQLVWDSLDASFTPSDIEARGIHLVGISLGSYVGLAMLAQRPAMVSTAVFSGMHSQKMKHSFLLKAFAILMTPFSRMSFMAKQTARMFGLTGDDVDIFAHEAGKTRLATIRSTIVQVIDYEVPGHLEAINARVLFVAGSNEHGTILNSLMELASNIKFGQAAIAPDLGHGWAGQDSDLFSDMISAHQIGAPLPKKLQIQFH